MTNAISFPGLPIIGDKVFTIDRVAFTVFGKDIMWYGVIIATGFILAAIYAVKRAEKFGTNGDELIDMLLWTLPIAIVGARTYYVLYEWDYYKENLSEIYKIWNGGLAIYGAVIAAFIVVYFFGKKRKADILGILDIGCIGLLIGQFIGRWANFINAEAFGGQTLMPWGMVINGANPVHPTFFYESLWNFIGFIAIHFYSKKRKFRGEIMLLYVAWYGLGRSWVEGMRTDSLYVGSTNIRASQLFAIITFLAAIGLLTYFYISKNFKVQTATEHTAVEKDNSQKVEAETSNIDNSIGTDNEEENNERNIN